MSRFSPDALTLARESRGFSQTALSRAVGMGQGTLSKIENGQSECSADVLSRLAETLRYPEAFFFQGVAYRSLPVAFFRKKMSIGKNSIKRVTALVNALRMQVRILLRSVELPANMVPHLDLNDYNNGDPEEVARDIRIRWHIQPGPIANLTRTLENVGVLVIEFDFGEKQIDGISLYEESDVLPPIIFVNPYIPGDRMRWTLAHETAHILLHNHLPMPPQDTEKQADRFAGELLMPADTIRPYLMRRRLGLAKFGELKQYWKVAIQALIMRAAALDIISARQKSYYFAEISKYGYRTKEPFPIPREQPESFKEIIDLHLNDLGYTVEQLAGALRIPIDDFEKYYRQSKVTNLRVVK